MNKAFLRCVGVLLSLFEEGFIGAYEYNGPRKRKKVLPYFHAVFRRWYFAALIENTPVSPANIFEAMSKYYEQEPGLAVFPVVIDYKNIDRLPFKLPEYSLNSHPVVDDMKRVIEYCTPSIDLDQDSSLADSQSMEIAATLSINDPHYASFLVEVAYRMGLLAKMPSIHANKMQLTKKCSEVFKLSTGDFLREVVDATISLAHHGIKRAACTTENIFSEPFIREMLSSPIDTDELFAKVLDAMGYELEDMLDVGSDTMHDMYGDMDVDEMSMKMEILSSTFVLGVVLDRYFFTPFGYFLRLIRPLYVLPFNVEGEISDFIDVYNDPDEAFVAFFAPCSSYTLTELGLEIMGVQPNIDNYIDASEVMNFGAMKETVFGSLGALKFFVEMANGILPVASANDDLGKVYTFRVRMEEKPNMWVHIQIPETMTLHHLFCEIAFTFDLDPDGSYSFFHDKKENRFAEYPRKSGNKAEKPKQPRNATKKTTDTALEELDFDHMKFMLLTVGTQSQILSKTSPRFQLEKLNEKDTDPHEIYPRISRASRFVYMDTDDV
ncbi:MAG: hypothetical protein FWC78_05870 [Defluviitaleaceae bacterium]|nr:hypothetical protein [Defluviitaleaceae bacterium]